MTIADKVTTSRLIFAPAFFVVYFLPRFFPSAFAVTPSPAEANSCFMGALWTVPVLWFLFVGSEITDMLDGMIARKRGEVNDFGKLYDPFADTLTQLAFFLCFVVDGILSPFLFLLVLYREFGILFVRNLMLKKGVAMGARLGGKIKTIAYILAGALALLAYSAGRLGAGAGLYRWLRIAANSVFAVSIIIAIVSFLDYVSVYRKAPEKN